MIDTLARMIAQAGVRPGMRVLAIGPGGSVAALLAEATGPAGHVVILDSDAETARAVSALRAAGSPVRMTVLAGDGEHGAPEHAPFDAIIASAGAWDVPGAWTVQLAEGGTLVVPCDVNGTPGAVAFRKVARHLASVFSLPSPRHPAERGAVDHGGSGAAASPTSGT